MAASWRSTLAPLSHVLRDPAGAVCSGSRHHSTADRLCIESALVRAGDLAASRCLTAAVRPRHVRRCAVPVRSMFFPDRSRALVEAFRVLKPGGRFLFSVWDRIEANEFADAVVKAVTALFPTDPPMFLARTPHGHYDAAALQAQLLTAGFRTTRGETITRESQSLSALSHADAERDRGPRYGGVGRSDRGCGRRYSCAVRLRTGAGPDQSAHSDGHTVASRTPRLVFWD